METRQVLRKDLVEPQLSYLIVGSLFEVYNIIGKGYQERIYQRAVATELSKRELKFREQVPMEILFDGKRVGKYFLDFLIEEKVILELKQGGHFSKNHFDQVKNYLSIYKYPLAILANFSDTEVVYRRILNPSLLNS